MWKEGKQRAVSGEIVLGRCGSKEAAVQRLLCLCHVAYLVPTRGHCHFSVWAVQQSFCKLTLVRHVQSFFHTLLVLIIRLKSANYICNFANAYDRLHAIFFCHHFLSIVIGLSNAYLIWQHPERFHWCNQPPFL